MEIKDLLGIPFKEGGFDLDGFSCWGLCCYVYKKFFGIEIPTYNADKICAVSKDAIKAFYNGMKDSAWKKIDKPKVPCIVIFREGKFITHCGVVIDKNQFIHVNKENGVLINRLNDPYWKIRIAGYYEYVGR